ncbi:hypothetical protein [Hymenobacter sp. CRA2]|uniref:hypothetical protein n=1 Tax=Hymenobacter sp. CRA2 TaxID=1955620 RepID=UPI00098F521C|nr:hypothetical protein [Hymenobacter sp. CRA2]OON69242.1 hypothetical protein B0919_08045 [Hymenobacter sp. CRA2]
MKAALAYYANVPAGDAAMVLFLLLVPLWLLNGVALFVSMFLLPRCRPYFQALLLSTILILVIGLGMCSFSLSRPNVH